MDDKDDFERIKEYLKTLIRIHNNKNISVITEGYAFIDDENFENSEEKILKYIKENV